MDLHIPDTCGECVLCEKINSGKSVCRYKTNICCSIGSTDIEAGFVDPEQKRPIHCPYNSFIIEIYALEERNRVREGTCGWSVIF